MFKEIFIIEDSLTSKLESIAQMFVSKDGEEIDYDDVALFIRNGSKKDIKKVKELLSELDDIDWDEEEGLPIYSEIIKIVSKY